MSVTSSSRILFLAVQRWSKATCSPTSSAKAVICLTTVRRQLMGSVQLNILPLLLAVCSHLPKTRLPTAFLHCMWRECVSTVFWSPKPKCFAVRVWVHISETNYQDGPHSLSHANALRCAIFSFSPISLDSATMPFNLQLADPADFFLGTQSWEQIGGLDKWHEY